MSKVPERLWVTRSLIASDEFAKSFAVPPRLRKFCVEYVSEAAITRILGERQVEILKQIEKAQKDMNTSGGLRALEHLEARLKESQAAFEAFKNATF